MSFFRMRNKLMLQSIDFQKSEFGGDAPTPVDVREVWGDIEEKQRASMGVETSAKQDFSTKEITLRTRAQSCKELKDPNNLPRYQFKELTGEERTLNPTNVEGGQAYDNYLRITCQIQVI